MPSIVNLKFKGNKSFVAFSNLSDTESLTKTWKVCTKVASYLEQGQRLENLSWRLWHLQSLIVETDNAKSKREFKKLSKIMGDKLDREKGRNIEELEAPDFKRNASTDLICQRAAERERSREASQNAKPGTIKRMQFTFSIDQPTPAGPNLVSKPDLKPSAEFKETTSRRGRQATRALVAGDESYDTTQDYSASYGSRKRKSPFSSQVQSALRFPTLFSTDFGPSALLSASPSLSTPMNYGEDVTNSSLSHSLSILRPTIELPLDELLSSVDSPEEIRTTPFQPQNDHRADNDIVMRDSQPAHKEPLPSAPAPQPAVPTKVGPSAGTRGNTPNGRPSLTVKTQNSPTARSSGPGATATSVNPALLRGNGNNSAPGGVKAECSNCGATHTPLWRRGLNDELNCNACGLYCKLHKRPRPKSMRSSHTEGGRSSNQSAPRQEVVEVTTGRSSRITRGTTQLTGAAGTAQCYNCHTTATPLWRKDDEGKTVCNACGLYYKLHGSARPISMKSDIIRKRSRHDARRSGPDSSDTPSASPGASRRPSPNLERSPTLAPDSTTQPTYEFPEEPAPQTSSSSELMGALGQEPSQNSVFNQGPYSNIYNPFPGPYHPDYLSQNFHLAGDALPFASVETLESEMNNGGGVEQRTTKRRRMSTDSTSASEPPSSAVSFSSYAESFSSATSHSRRSSMDFPFFTPYSVFRGSGNAFWHPPMLPTDRSPQFIHPPMLPAEEPTMDFLHPPMLPQEEDNLFATYLHPPMMLPAEDPNMQHQSQQAAQQKQAHCVQPQPQQQHHQQAQQSLGHQGHQGRHGYPAGNYNSASNQQTAAEYYESAMQTY